MLQIANLKKISVRAKTRLQIDDRFVDAILSNSSKRVDHLVRVYTKRGAGRAAITNAIQRASAGVLNIKSYTDDDFDMATVLLRTGGRKLLYTTNNGLELPSYTALQSRAEVTHLLPSLGAVSNPELQHNISEVFGKSRIALPSCGHSVVIDEIALEERIVFVRWLRALGGFCWEHSKDVNKAISTIAHMKDLALRLILPAKDPKAIHHAKEATVIGVAAFRSEHYQAMPIAAAGTCKQSTAADCVVTIKTIPDAWKTSPDGEKRHGPIWSFASDGDGVRRAAFHTAFTSCAVTEENPLFKLLGSLAGFNLKTGTGDVTAEFDPKHIFKRMFAFLNYFANSSMF